MTNRIQCASHYRRRADHPRRGRHAAALRREGLRVAARGSPKAYRISSPYKLAGRGFRPEGTIVKFANGVTVGGNEVVIMGGPCSVEVARADLLSGALVKAAGGQFLRGGAFKPRSSPYSFQGMGTRGPQAAARGRRRHRPAHHQRGHGDLADRADAALRRRLPGRRAQHAELQPAARARPGPQAGGAQARHVGDHRRTAALAPSTFWPVATTT